MIIAIPVERWFAAARQKFVRMTLRMHTFLRIRALEIWVAPWLLLIAVVIGTGMGVWLGLRAGVLWFLFLTFVLYAWDSRVMGVAAIVCLITCPALLGLHQDDLAEEMAVYAYFFMVMSVALQVIEYHRHPERFVDEEETSPSKDE